MPLSSWSTTPATNATADSASGIIWSEGQAPASINDSARAMMAEIKKFYDAPSITTNYVTTANFRANTGGGVQWLEATNNNHWLAANASNNLTWTYNGTPVMRFEPTVGQVLVAGFGLRFYEATNNNQWTVSNTTNNLVFSYNGSSKISLPAAGGITPAVDNSAPSGGPSLRWNVVYAGTGTINTSDATEKANLADPGEALFDAILSVPMYEYQWKDAVAEKGAEEARWHYGPTAQGVRDALANAGLNPHRYALFCEDTLDDGGVRLGLRLDQFDRIRTEAIRRKLVAI